MSIQKALNVGCIAVMAVAVACGRAPDEKTTVNTPAATRSLEGIVAPL
jgi:hypothetical protein